MRIERTRLRLISPRTKPSERPRTVAASGTVRSREGARPSRSSFALCIETFVATSILVLAPSAYDWNQVPRPGGHGLVLPYNPRVHAAHAVLPRGDRATTVAEPALIGSCRSPLLGPPDPHERGHLRTALPRRPRTHPSERRLPCAWAERRLRSPSPPSLRPSAPS